MQGQVPRLMGMVQPNMAGNQNMMQGDQSMMFNQQQQQQRMVSIIEFHDFLKII